MTALVRFKVLGVPAPQGSKRAFVVAGRAQMVESAGTKLDDWRGDVSRAAAHAWGDRDAITGPVELSITFRMPRPKSAPKRAVWAAKRPDLDKLLRSTLDALTQSGVIGDDSQIVRVVAAKVLATVDRPWTGAVIGLYPADDLELLRPVEFIEGAA